MATTLRLIAFATAAAVPTGLALALWYLEGHGGFLLLASAFAAAALAAWLALRDLPGALAGAQARAGDAHGELERTRSEVRESALAVDEAAAGLALGNRSLSERSEGQSGAIERTMASVGELARSVDRNTQAARSTQDVATAARESTSKGIEAATMVIARMESIREATAKVAEIVGIIDAIAFQTRILALNASVEAAHAGEQGRGFAVVATEVRSLSLRCSDAALEIRRLVGSAAAQVDESSDVVDEVAEAIAAINAHVAEVNALMDAIAAAGAEQSSGIALIGESIAQVERDSRQNAGLVREIAGATGTLAAQAERLARIAKRNSIDNQEGELA